MRWLASILAVLCLAGCGTGPKYHGLPVFTDGHGIPNFAVVVPAHDGRPGIYRGGQPGLEGYAYLHSLGVTDIVKLNGGTDSLEFKQHNFPISFWHQLFWEPSLHEVSLACDSIKPGTFIHCTHGQDRTGLVVAEYRVWYQYWPMPAARTEMLEHGFHRILFGLDWFWNHRRYWERKGDDFYEP